jgi:hypothetical protein
MLPWSGRRRCSVEVESMTDLQAGPLWLAVPAAAGSACFETASAGHCRLLQVQGDQGWSGGSSISERGRSKSEMAIPPLKDALHGRLRRAVGCTRAPAGPFTIRVVLELGRCSPGSGEAGAEGLEPAYRIADADLATAMTAHQLDRALSAGRQAVERAKLDGVGLIVVSGAGGGLARANANWMAWLAGEAAASGSSSVWADGTNSVQRPLRSLRGISETLPARHASLPPDPYMALRDLGGFEHAALAGAMLSAAQLGLPALALGSSAHIAMRLAMGINGSIGPWVRSEPLGSGYEPDPVQGSRERQREGAAWASLVCME